MSHWTHVCGCVRIDSIFHEDVNARIEEVFGKILCYDDLYEEWKLQESNPELYTPTGSEGGIKYFVWENPEECHMASHTVSIWGDLRDYTSVEEIAEWFNKIVYNSGFCIRDAVLSIDEGYKKTVLLYQYRAKECIVFKEE